MTLNENNADAFDRTEKSDMSGTVVFDIPDYIGTALNALRDAGYEGYLVGGCVRDILAGKTPHDYDITTNALPEQLMELFASFKCVESGLKHGTLTVIIEHKPVEITTHRTEGAYSDHRRPDSVGFTSELRLDLSRRDFTVNAMAYGDKCGLVDYFGGREDMKNHTIRCVGDADTRFREDALRILRALRFASRMDYEIEEQTGKSLHRNKDLLNEISRERIYSEFKGILAGKAAPRLLSEYMDVISVFISGSSPYNAGCDFYSLSRSPDGDAPRLALFFAECKIEAAEAREILSKLRSDRKTAERVCVILKNMNLPLTSFSELETDTQREAEVKKLLGAFGYEVLSVVLDVISAFCRSPAHKNEARALLAESILSMARELDEARSCVTLSELAVNGNDLISELSLKSGREVGRLLSLLLEAVVEGRVQNTKEELLLYIANM